MGVGDVGAVSCWARRRRDTTGGDDGRCTGWECKPGLVGGYGRTEQDAASECCSSRIGIDDGTRIDLGGCCTYSAGEGGAHGMRVDGLAVGDVSSVSCGARRRRDTSDSYHGRVAGREHDSGVVGGHSGTEQDAASEPRRHGIGVDDGTRIGHGCCGVYSKGSDGSHGMRGDGVAVGDVGALSCGARGRRDTSGGDDGSGGGRERDAGVVGGHSRTE